MGQGKPGDDLGVALDGGGVVIRLSFFVRLFDQRKGALAIMQGL